MTKFRIVAVVISLSVLVMLSFSGCSLRHINENLLGPLNTPPDVDSVQQQLLEHREDVQVIVAFLIESGDEWICIDDTSGTLLADLDTVSIDDAEVLDAICQLFDSGYCTSIIKKGTTISFEQWRAFQLDIVCGIAYLADESADLEIQFLTEAVALPENGWYYYVADYELWRTQNGT